MGNLSTVLLFACETLAFFMLLMAMLISTATAVHQMIPLYQYQSVALALITLLTAVTIEEASPLTRLIVSLFTLIPIILIVMINRLLVLATVPEDISTLERIKRLFNRQVIDRARQHAYPIWLAQRTPTGAGFGTILIDLLLILLAFVVAFSLGQGRFTANILAISLSLLLLGLSIMRSKQDIISQVMGLLIMEHGMFLAAIRLTIDSIVIVNLVAGLFLYIIITLTILIFLLPDLHRISGTINIDQQEQLKG